MECNRAAASVKGGCFEKRGPKMEDKDPGGGSEQPPSHNFTRTLKGFRPIYASAFSLSQL